MYLLCYGQCWPYILQQIIMSLTTLPGIVLHVTPCSYVVGPRQLSSHDEHDERICPRGQQPGGLGQAARACWIHHEEGGHQHGPAIAQVASFAGWHHSMTRDTCSSALAAYISSRLSGYISAAPPRPSRASCAMRCTVSARAASSSSCAAKFGLQACKQLLACQHRHKRVPALVLVKQVPL